MRFYFTRSGLPAPKSFVLLLVSFISAVLVTSMLSSTASAEDPKPAGVVIKGDSDGDGDIDRPDSVSASSTARASQKPVEDLSKRTENSRTFFNPDGTLSDEQYGTAVRVLKDGGRWADVDYDLEKQADGSYKPKAVSQDVTIDGGDSKEAARISFDDGTLLAVSWPTTLPEPSIEGATATYKLSAATDLLVTATGGGVATRIRLNSEPAADDPAFTLGLRADDVQVDQVASGGLKVTDDDNKQLGTTSTLIAWDAQLDDSGDPINVVPVEADLSEGSTKGDVTTHELDLKTPEGFLSDPDTEYPVTIDPDINAVTQWRDTWVRSGTTANQGNSYRLLVASLGGDSNTNPARSLIQWHETQFLGKKIISATMGVYQYDAGSCAARDMYALPLSSGFTEGSTVWTNAPGYIPNSGDNVTVTANRGRTGCTTGNGYTTANITKMVASWASGRYPNNGLMLTPPAAVGKDTSYERRFCSWEPDPSATQTPCTTATRVPYLKVTYDGPPKTAAVPTVSPATSDDTTLWTTSKTPTFEWDCCTIW